MKSFGRLVMKSFGRLVMIAAASAAGLVAIDPQVIEQRQLKPRRRIQVQMQDNRISRLNRSKRWDYAETYKEARAISPFPHRPVR